MTFPSIRSSSSVAAAAFAAAVAGSAKYPSQCKSCDNDCLRCWVFFLFSWQVAVLFLYFMVVAFQFSICLCLCSAFTLCWRFLHQFSFLDHHSNSGTEAAPGDEEERVCDRIICHHESSQCAQTLGYKIHPGLLRDVWLDVRECARLMLVRVNEKGKWDAELIQILNKHRAFKITLEAWWADVVKVKVGMWCVEGVMGWCGGCNGGEREVGIGECDGVVWWV